MSTSRAASTLLKDVAVTGVGTAIMRVDGLGVPKTAHTIEITFKDVTGVLSALSVALEGSLGTIMDDGTTFFRSLMTDDTPYALTAGDISAKGAIFHITNRACVMVRANITTLTTSGSAAVTVKYL